MDPIACFGLDQISPFAVCVLRAWNTHVGRTHGVGSSQDRREDRFRDAVLPEGTHDALIVIRIVSARQNMPRRTFGHPVSEVIGFLGQHPLRSGHQRPEALFFSVITLGSSRALIARSDGTASTRTPVEVVKRVVTYIAPDAPLYLRG
eukprot:1166466-Rhodomonas_salina.3